MLHSSLSAGGVGGVVVEWLVMELEEVIRAVRPGGIGRHVGIRALGSALSVGPAGSVHVAVSVGPAACVPGPVDPLGTKPRADRRCRLGRQTLGERRTR